MTAEAKPMRRKRIRMTPGDRVFTTLVYLFLVLFFIVELYPMIFVLSASFSNPTAVATGKMLLLPVEPSLDGYKYILQYNEIWIGYKNTLFYTVIGTLVNLIVTIPAAYALSRKDMKGTNLFMILFMFTMYFSGGMIPGYLNMKSFGLLDTPYAMLISGALSVYNLIVARTFFANTIPWELHEAARIDGASDFRTFFKIVLPLSAPIIVVMTLYYGVGHWNSYFTGLIYLTNRKLYPLQMFLREILVLSKFSIADIADGSMDPEEIAYMLKQAETANMVKYCIIIVSVLPMLVIYPWVQKFFAKGVMIGSVKG